MPTTPALESISLDALTTITGGCKKRCAPPPPPAEAAPEPAGPLVSTAVSITGYGAPSTQTA